MAVGDVYEMQVHQQVGSQPTMCIQHFVETLTSTGARREARALVMDAETLQAVRETIAGRRG